AAAGEFTVDGNGNTTIKGTLGAGANGTEFQVGSTGNVYAQALAFNSDQTKMVNAIDQGTAITDGEATTSARKETMATTATVAKTVGNLAALYDGSETAASHGITNVADVASAISTLSQNVETATGGTFAGAVWTGAVNAAKSVDYTYSPAATATATAGYHDIMSAVSQVASNVGAATTVAFNNVAAGNTVNANIDALNSKVGDMNTIGYGYKNLSNGTTTQPDTVVTALQNIDASMGTIHGLAAKLKSEGKYQGNLAEGTTVEQHLTALDSAIGNRANFEKMHYTQGSKSVVDAIGKLDTKLNSVDHDVRTLRHHFQSGMASAAALSALVPNARAHGNTQLSVGTGMYHGHGAMAVGGFHWFTDNILFNTGIAWDDNEATYRMGVTYSW
ncbi:MAG: YadA C-terminal domain-containing protein, partial [Alphaproteobacteria bacterium]